MALFDFIGDLSGAVDYFHLGLIVRRACPGKRPPVLASDQRDREFNFESQFE